MERVTRPEQIEQQRRALRVLRMGDAGNRAGVLAELERQERELINMLPEPYRARYGAYTAR